MNRTVDLGPVTPQQSGIGRTLDSDTFPQLPFGSGGSDVFPAPPVAPAGGKTVDGLHVNRTVDLGPAAPPAIGGRTLDSDSFSGAGNTIPGLSPFGSSAVGGVPDGAVGGVVGLGGTVHERPVTRTVEAQLSNADVTRMTAMWSSIDPRHVTSRTSIKAEGTVGGPRTPARRAKKEEPSKSSLVIHPRAFRRDPAGRPDSDYDILSLLGEGGMGSVYAARQASIDRTVALKMLKPGAKQDREQQEKFLSEAVVTGDLEHPNIVPIYDLGTNEEGALFYAMKRVKGTPWMEVIRQKSLPENLEILMKVCDAMAFAHSKKVIHRDLKPENVMLGGFGEVLVMDWGLAIPSDGRRIGGLKLSTSMGGTPAYMAPEMAVGPFDRIGLTSDVYLLGAILFEIIAEQPPHTGADVMKCLFAAAKNQIVPTDRTGELLDIAYKAMATRIEDRYPTVQDFQQAIRDYQSHSESIALSTRAQEDLDQAQQTNDYQDFSRALFGFQEALKLWDGNVRAAEGLIETKFLYAKAALAKGDFDLGSSLLDLSRPDHAELNADLLAAKKEREERQHKLKLAKRIAAVAAVLFVVIVSGFAVWAMRERSKAVVASKQATEKSIEAEKQKLKAQQSANEALAAKAAADESAKKAREEETKALAAKTAADESAVKAKKSADEALAAKTAADESAKKAREEETKAVAASAQAVKEQRKAEYQAYIALIGLAAAKIDENAFGSARELLDLCPAQFRNWEWGRLRHLCNQSVLDYRAAAPIDAAAFSADGQRIVTGGWNGAVKLWNTATADELLAIPHGDVTFVYAVALSPDGKFVVTASDDAKEGYLRFWDAATGQLIRRLDGHRDSVVSLAFSQDGKRLLSGSHDRTARLWDLATGQSRVFRGHRGYVWSVAFSPDEKQFVTAGQDGFAIAWSVESGQSLPPFRGHQGPVYSAAFSPDGQSVISGGLDKRVLLWKPSELSQFDFEKAIQGQAVEPPKFRAFDGHTAAVRSVAFDRDGKRLLSGGHDNTVRVWDAANGTLLKTLRGHDSWVRACAFSPDGQWVLSAGHDARATRWSLDRYEEVRRVPQGRVLEGHAGDILSAAFSRDGQFLVTASRDRTARSWHFASGQTATTFEEGHDFLASNVVFFPDGKRLATGAVDNTVRIWSVANGTELLKLDLTGRSAAVAVSPDGRWVLTGSNGRTAKLWEFVTEKNADGRTVERAVQRKELNEHLAAVSVVSISPDGQRLFTGDANGRGNLWDAQGAHQHRLAAHTGRLSSAVFTSDSRRLLTASGDGTVAQWDVATGREDTTRILKHTRGQEVMSLAITPDDKLAVTACNDKRVRVWDLATAKVVRELTPTSPRKNAQGQPLGQVNAVAVSPQGGLALTVNAEERTVRLWQLDKGTEVAIGGEPYLDFARRGAVWSAGFSRDGQQVVTVGGDNARLWDLRPGLRPERETMVFLPHGAVASAQFSHDGRFVVTGSWDTSARIWDAATGRGLLKLDGGHEQNVNTATFSPADVRLVLTASDDKTAKLWDLRSRTVRTTLSGHTDEVKSAAFSADGRFVVTASSDATARVWDAATGQSLHELRGHKYGLLCAAFSHDGRRVITGSRDNTAKIWDVATERVVLTLEGHTAAVTSVAFSPLDHRVLTGSEDYTAKVWDAEKDAGQDAAQPAVRNVSTQSDPAAPAPVTPAPAAVEPRKAKEILTLKGHTQEVTSVSFSSGDGRYALTGSRDGTAIVWLADEWEEKRVARKPAE